MEEIRIDLRQKDEARSAESRRTAKAVYRFNQLEPYTEESMKAMYDIFTGGIGEGSSVHSPVFLNIGKNIHIGRNVVIMPYFRCMSAGQVYIDDDVRIAMNVSIITNNHDFYERDVLTVKDVHIGRNAWIGAGSTILPGVTVGENAIVGASSVVTKDVAPNTVVAGNPAKVIKVLDAEKFKKAK